MLASALEHYRRQQRIQAQGIIAARRARRRSLARAAVTVAAYQVLAAEDAVSSVERMLDEQDLDAPPVAGVAVTSLAGTASDGRPLATLLEQAETDYQFALIVATQLKDIGRMAAGTSIASRPGVSGYTRMLNPPSCSRCAVLAGRRYRWNDGFERHPGCDCVHVPTRYESSATADGLVADPKDYFDSLPSAEQLTREHPDLTVKMRRESGLYSQEDIFTKAGARAIRDGADIGQVVNARRGMSTAQINPGRGWIPRGRLTPVQVGGRDVFVTTESTTIRGLSSRRRTGRNMSARLMPESIYTNARTHEEAIRLLRLHGYLR